MVAVEAETGHNVVRGHGGSDEGGRLDALHVNLLVLVALFGGLADDVEVLPLLHLPVKRSIDLHRQPPRQFLLHTMLKLRIGVFLQDGIVDGGLGQLVLVRDALGFVRDNRQRLAHAVVAQTVTPSRCSHDDVKVYLGIGKGGLRAPRFLGLRHFREDGGRSARKKIFLRMDGK